MDDNHNMEPGEPQGVGEAQVTVEEEADILPEENQESTKPQMKPAEKCNSYTESESLKGMEPDVENYKESKVELESSKESLEHDNGNNKTMNTELQKEEKSVKDKEASREQHKKTETERNVKQNEKELGTEENEAVELEVENADEPETEENSVQSGRENVGKPDSEGNCVLPENAKEPELEENVELEGEKAQEPDTWNKKKQDFGNKERENENKDQEMNSKKQKINNKEQEREKTEVENEKEPMTEANKELEQRRNSAEESNQDEETKVIKAKMMKLSAQSRGNKEGGEVGKNERNKVDIEGNTVRGEREKKVGMETVGDCGEVITVDARNKNRAEVEKGENCEKEKEVTCIKRKNEEVLRRFKSGSNGEQWENNKEDVGTASVDLPSPSTSQQAVTVADAVEQQSLGNVIQSTNSDKHLLTDSTHSQQPSPTLQHSMDSQKPPESVALKTSGKRTADDDDDIAIISEISHVSNGNEGKIMHEVNQCPPVCSKCNDTWNDDVLSIIFRGTQTITVNSKITYGAIILINNYAEKNFMLHREHAVRALLQRADLGKNIARIKMSEVNNWIRELMQDKKITCCKVFDAFYKPKLISSLTSSVSSSKATEGPKTSSEQKSNNKATNPTLKTSKKKAEAGKSGSSFMSGKRARQDVGNDMEKLPTPKCIRGYTTGPKAPRVSEKQTNELLVGSTTGQGKVDDKNENEMNRSDGRKTQKASLCNAEVLYDLTGDSSFPSVSTPISKLPSSSKSLCAVLNLDVTTLDTYDLEEEEGLVLTNKLVIENTPDKCESSFCHHAMLLEHKVLRGYAKEAFELLTFEPENCSSVPSDPNCKERYITNREFLTLESICILKAQSPDDELFYQILVDLLLARWHILLIPDSLTLLSVAKKVRKRLEVAKMRGSYDEFLAQPWDRYNVYSARDLRMVKLNPNRVPKVCDILSVFCCWKNSSENDLNFPLSEIINLLCGNVDFDTTHVLGTCITLYGKFCQYLYERENIDLAMFFLKQTFTSPSKPNYKKSVSPPTRTTLFKNITSTDKQLQVELEKCKGKEEITFTSELSQKDALKQCIVNLKKKMNSYMEVNKQMVKRLEEVMKKKQDIHIQGASPQNREMMEQLHEAVTSVHQTLVRKRSRDDMDSNERSKRRCGMENSPSIHTWPQAANEDNTKSDFMMEVPAKVQEVVLELLANQVEVHQIRPVIQQVMMTAANQRITSLPTLSWIKSFARLHGFCIQVT